MPEFVRVKHPIFGEFSARRPNLDEVQVLDKPAVNTSGRPLPGKPKTSVAAKAAENKSKTPTNGAEPATTPEEGSES